MNIKRISAAVMAAAVLSVGAPVMGLSDPFGVVASAAEEKLVTGTLDWKIPKNMISTPDTNLGNGFFAFSSIDMQARVMQTDNVIRIGDKEIAQWRSTGKLEPAEIQCDIAWQNYAYDGANDDYVKFIDRNKKANIFKLDKTSEKINKVYTCDSKDARLLENGYSIDWENKTVYTPTGEKIDFSDKSLSADSLINGMGKYLAYAWTFFGTKIYGICADGTVEEYYSTTDMIFECYTGDGFLEIKTFGSQSITFFTADGNEYKFDDVNGISSVYGTTAVASKNGQYMLIDLNDNGKALSKTYRSIETRDNGKTYLVKSEDGKCGYIDGTGKELAMFDKASCFVENGLYAPVVQDGKGWLVDKNMNQVSEKIDAEDCMTSGAELFIFTVSEEKADYVFATSTGKGTDGAASTEPGNSGNSGNSGNTGNETALTDKNSGVSVNGNFPSGTKLNVTKTKKSDNTYTVDITPIDASGNKVQPNGAAVVMAMIPELKGKNVNVYRVEDGNYTKLNSWTDGDGIFFTTTHFSEFEITTEQREEANPKTGSAGIAGFAAVALAGMGILVVSRKKR